MQKLFLEQEQFSTLLDESSNKIASCIKGNKPYIKYVEHFFNKVCLAENAPYVLSEVLSEAEINNNPDDLRKIISVEYRKLNQIINNTIKKLWDQKIKPALQNNKTKQMAMNYFDLIKKLGSAFYKTVQTKMDARKRLGGEDVKSNKYKTDILNRVNIKNGFATRPMDPKQGDYYHVHELIDKLKDQFINKKDEDIFYNFLASNVDDKNLIHKKDVQNFFNKNNFKLKKESTQNNSNLLESFKMMISGKFTPEWLVKNVESCIKFYEISFEEAVKHANKFGKERTLIKEESINYLDRYFNKQSQRNKNLIALANTFNDEIQNSSLSNGIKDYVKNMILAKIKKEPDLIFKTLFPEKNFVKKDENLAKYDRSKKYQVKKILEKLMADVGASEYQINKILYGYGAASTFEKFLSQFSEKDKKYYKDIVIDYLDMPDGKEEKEEEEGGDIPVYDSPDDVSRMKSMFTTYTRFMDDLFDPDPMRFQDDYIGAVKYVGEKISALSVGKKLAALGGIAAVAGLILYGVFGTGGQKPTPKEVEEARTVMVAELQADNTLPTPDPSGGAVPKPTSEIKGKEQAKKTGPTTPPEQGKSQFKSPQASYNQSNAPTSQAPAPQASKPQLPIEELVKVKSFLNKGGYLGQSNLMVQNDRNDPNIKWVFDTDNLGKKVGLGKMLPNSVLVDKVNRAKNLGINFNPAKYSFEWEDETGKSHSEFAANLNIRGLEQKYKNLNAAEPVAKGPSGDPFQLAPKRDYMDKAAGDSNMAHPNPKEFLDNNPGKGMELVKNGFQNVDKITAYALASSPNSLDYNGFSQLLKNGNNSSLTNSLIKTQMDILKGGHTVTPYNLQQAAKQHNNDTSSSTAATPQQASQPEPQQASQASAPPQKETSPAVKKLSVDEYNAATVQKRLDSGEDAGSILKSLEKIDNKTANTLFKSGKITNIEDLENLLSKASNWYALDADLEVDAALQIEKMGGEAYVTPNQYQIQRSIKNGKSPYDIIGKYAQFEHKNLQKKLKEEPSGSLFRVFWGIDKNLSQEAKISNLAKRYAAEGIINYFGGIDKLKDNGDMIFTSVVKGLALHQAISQEEAQILMKNADLILEPNAKKQLKKIADGEVKPFNEHRSFRSFLESKLNS